MSSALMPASGCDSWTTPDMLRCDPNRLADAYRACNSAFATQRAHTDLDFLAFNTDGNLLLGASHLYGRFWTGAIWYYRDPADAPDANLSLTGVECESGVTDGAFLDTKRMVVVQDSGTVEVVEVAASENSGGESHHFSTLASSCQHDDSVLSVSVATGGRKVVTAGFDMCVKVWDMESMVAEKSYFPAHSQMVTSVSSCPVEEAIFVSCSPDGLVLIWDTRLGKPARAVCESFGDPPSCVSWQPLSERNIGIGFQSGRARIADVRQTGCPNGGQGVKVLGRGLHRIAFATHSPGLMAACGDESKVHVVNWAAAEPSVIYESKSHPDFVRGLAWNPSTNKLHSCGWQKTMVVHDLAAMDMNGHGDSSAEQSTSSMAS